MVRVNQMTTYGGNATFTYAVRSSSSSSFLIALNNQVKFYVWVPIDVNITIADKLLSSVSEWREGGCARNESHQNTRIKVQAVFTDHQEMFMWDIYDQVSHLVSHLDSMLFNSSGNTPQQ